MLQENSGALAKSIATDGAMSYLREIWQALNGNPEHLDHLAFTGAGDLPSVFAVTDLASAAIGAASPQKTSIAMVRNIIVTVCLTEFAPRPSTTRRGVTAALP